MKEQPLVGITYELIFQMFNTLILLAILGLIVYGIYFITSRVKNKNKEENRIIELENRIKELEDKINNDKI
ncbi:hypothetical protein [Clostridium sp. CCUG 7971]|uniref:hypothetical protein n=1 Tax=Clostridium sp. CCUG 7971 TaxID=2811414 RepID=UPI001ABA9B52|nr:hypothetical protein [Clostridium sp. CCUG 7971]MBO3443106.1 hypothetical protein [Clostridium sp. CCUG 7971]